MQGPITCHVLDVALGKPAEGVPVALHVSRDAAVFEPVSARVTDADGRCTTLLPPRASAAIVPGTYKLIFKPQEYFDKTGRTCFYPWIEIPFRVENTDEHYHIPLLISPYSFTTYRGS